MNPKPLVALNHFTVPTGMSASSYLHARTIDLRETRKATCKRHPSAWLGRELPIGYYVVVGVGTNGKIRSVRRNRGFAGLVLVGVMLVVTAACSKSDVVSEPSPTSASRATLAIKLSEFKVVLPSMSLTRGRRAFEISNAGHTPHELLVFRSDLDPSKYPLENGDINEQGPGIAKISDGDNLDPGKHQSRVVDLTTP